MSKVLYSKRDWSDEGAEPFVMERFGGGGQACGAAEDGKNTGKVGDDIVAIEREAYEKGFTAGEKAGFEMGRKKAEVLFQGLSGVLAELNTFRESLYKGCEAEMVELVMAIARKVIPKAIEQRRETVVDCVKAALDVVVASGEILVKANPKDLEVIHQYTEELTRYTDGVKEVKVEADESIMKGGCVIETNYGEVDATINGVMAELEERLRDEL